MRISPQGEICMGALILATLSLLESRAVLAQVSFFFLGFPPHPLRPFERILFPDSAHRLCEVKFRGVCEACAGRSLRDANHTPVAVGLHQR